MRYMLLIYSQETAEPLAPEDVTALRTAHGAVMDESARRGVLRGVERLKPTVTATTVRNIDGSAITTDGPFAETKEQLAGYYIVECDNLDEAIEWAKKIPTSCRGGSGCIEVRPIDDLPPRV
jgi:hypothetical protein